MRFNTALSETYQNLRSDCISVVILTFALLASACIPSSHPATIEPSPTRIITPASALSDLPLPEIPQSKYLRFGRLTAEDGLSNDQVRGIVQDSHGFVWITTFDGLNRYDGSSIKVYRHDPDDPDSLSNNTVRIPIVDRDGDLWFGTFGGGLNQYDAENDAFIRYRHDPDDPHSLSNDIIRAVYEDRSGAIWVGTNIGLNRLNRDSKQFTRYLHDSSDPNSLSDNLVLAVFEDSTGVFWIGTEGGLNRFDPITEQFVHYEHSPDVSTSLSDNTVNEIREDSSGFLWLSTDLGLCRLDLERTRFTCYQHDAADPQTISNNAAYGLYVDQRDDIWVGTWGGGLNRFDRDTERFIHYQHHPADPYSVGSNNVDSIYEDRNGMLWISTDGGVSLLDGKGKPFTHYRVMPDDPKSLTIGEVRTLFVSAAGDTWVGTAGGGTSKFDHRTEEFTHYRHNPDDPNSLMGDAVWAIYEDGEGMMWVGSYGFGLSMFDPDSGRFTHYQFDPEDPMSLSDNAVTSMHEDQSGRFWISTENGLNRFDDGTFTRYEHDPDNPQSLSSNTITVVYEDRAGELWIGAVGGLDQFSPEEGTFTRYHHDPANPESLGNSTVTSMVEDQAGNLWIGTLGGLDKFDRENEQFTHYTSADGLSSDAIFGILADDQGLLWIGTSSGLSRFDPETERFRNYKVRDGLQSDSFLFYSAYAKGQNGELFFGGTNGFNAFFPEQITDNLTPPPVVVTDFQLANRPVPIGGDSVLQASILETDELVLSHQDEVFSFEFAALNYQVPEKNRYKYRMEGFEEDWNEVDSDRRFAAYTNLDPGDYVFRVIAANNDGVWNEEGAAITITVTPPWWQTNWFRFGLGILVIGLLAGGYRWRVWALEARSRELQTQMQTVFENSPVGIGMSTPAGEILTVNPAMAQMLGVSAQEMQQQGVSDFYVDPLDREKLLAELQRRGVVQDFGTELLRSDESTFYASINMNQIERQGQDVLLTLIEDVTDQLEAEQNAAVLAERERLARELHDSVTQTVYSASLLAESVPKLWEKDRALAQSNMNRLSQLLRAASADMRALLYELRSSARQDQTLAKLIEPLLVSVQARTSTIFHLTSEGDCKYPDTISLTFFRIVQECLNNIAKHAQATEATITLDCEPESLKLTIVDNGSGFDVTDIQPGHLGLNIMRERAQNIEASFDIDSTIGIGTQITVQWPADKGMADG